MTTFNVNGKQRKLIFFGVRDNHFLVSHGEAFPHKKYEAYEDGLMYCKFYPTYFNGPFYGFTPGTCPGTGSFRPELFFIHGPAFVGNADHARSNFWELLQLKDGKERLIQCIHEVLKKRNPSPAARKYETDASYSRTYHNTLVRTASDAKDDVIIHLNGYKRNHSFYTIDQQKFNQLMERFDEKTRILYEACLRRDNHIRQMNAHYDLQNQQINDFNTLYTMFGTISQKQNDLQKQLVEITAKVDKFDRTSHDNELGKEINLRLDTIASFMSGISIGAAAGTHTATSAVNGKPGHVGIRHAVKVESVKPRVSS